MGVLAAMVLGSASILSSTAYAALSQAQARLTGLIPLGASDHPLLMGHLRHRRAARPMSPLENPKPWYHSKKPIANGPKGRGSLRESSEQRKFPHFDGPPRTGPRSWSVRAGSLYGIPTSKVPR